MSAFWKKRLQRLAFGVCVYGEHEELQAFQHRFLISIALCAVVFNIALILSAIAHPQDRSVLAFVLSCWSIAIVAYLLVWRWLCSHPHALKLGSLLIATLYWLNLCVPGMALPPDPLMPMWTMLLIVAVFMMNGRVWGWLSLVVALFSSHMMLSRVDLAPFPSSLWTVWFSSIAAATLGHIYAARFSYFFSRMAFYNERLQWLSTHDSLTGTLNAGAFYEQCNRQLALCRRKNLPFAVLFVDLDHFKSVNDHYGHAMGDEVLMSVATVLRTCLRESDLLGRVGGEEFSIFLTDATLDDSGAVAERIRASIEEQQMSLNDRHISVTASIGLTWASRSEQPFESIHQIQPLADRAMYEAKRAGRNQVALFGQGSALTNAE